MIFTLKQNLIQVTLNNYYTKPEVDDIDNELPTLILEYLYYNRSR